MQCKHKLFSCRLQHLFMKHMVLEESSAILSGIQAKKIEALWQEVMQVYLTCTPDGTLIRAENSSHYIHLTDSELICGILIDRRDYS